MPTNSETSVSDPAVLKERMDDARAQVDAHIISILDRAGDLPLYDMLRYFMGYTNRTRMPAPGMHGKRTRSALLLLVADMCGGSPAARDLAAAVELFHNFTLIHDDIEDHDEMRRGQPTVWSVWGVDHGINAGDAQFVLVDECLLRAAGMGSDPAAAALMLNSTFREVIEGQYLDFELTRMTLDDPAVTVDAYLEMIRKKTAVLIGVAAAAGGRSAGADGTTTQALYRFGESLGMAYQIVDDMVSIWGDSSASGKEAHGDLKQRKKTYPVLYAFMHGAPADLMRFYTKVDQPTETEMEQIARSLDATGARDATRELAGRFMDAAHEAVRALPIDEQAHDMLRSLVTTVAASAGVTELGAAAAHVEYAA